MSDEEQETSGGAIAYTNEDGGSNPSSEDDLTEKANRIVGEEGDDEETGTKTSEQGEEGSSSEAAEDKASVTAAGKAKAHSNELQQDGLVVEMSRKVEEMEEEVEKIKKMQDAVETSISEDKVLSNKEAAADADKRSVYIGNVDYSATAQELSEFFKTCGTIIRVTIVQDKYTLHPKGFAYIEFEDSNSVKTAVHLDDSLFKGRQIKVTPKRTNVPSFIRGGGYGRGFRGRGSWRGGYRGRRPYRGFRPY